MGAQFTIEGGQFSIRGVNIPWMKIDRTVNLPWVKIPSHRARTHAVLSPGLLVEQEVLTLPELTSLHPVLVGFLLLDLQFYVYVLFVLLSFFF
jgi:hypothetical protein